MQTSAELRDLDKLRQSLEEELRRLKTLAEQIDTALQTARVSERLEQARHKQADSGWIAKLREQYNAEVCRSTLETNAVFAVAEK